MRENGYKLATDQTVTPERLQFHLMIAPDGAFEHVFAVPGTCKYFCIPHEGADMLGSIIVNA